MVDMKDRLFFFFTRTLEENRTKNTISTGLDSGRLCILDHCSGTVSAAREAVNTPEPEVGTLLSLGPTCTVYANRSTQKEELGDEISTLNKFPYHYKYVRVLWLFI